MFWLTLLSVGVQSNKSLWREIFFRFYFFRHRKNVHEESSLKFLVKITNGVSQEGCKNLSNSDNLVLMKIIFHNFFWTTFLSVGVQRTDDRKEKEFFGESMFSLESVLLKKFWLVWYDSSKGVHTHDDKI